MSSDLMKNITFGKGIVYFDPYDANGVLTGEKDCGAVPSLTLTPKIDTYSHISSRNGISIEDYRVNLSQTITASFTFEEMTSDNISKFFMGTVNMTNQPAHTQQSPGQKYLTNIKKERWYDLGCKKITGIAGTVVPLSGPLFSWADSDYELDTENGRIYIPELSAINDGYNLGIEFISNSFNLTTIQANKISMLRGALRFISKNPTGRKWSFYAKKVVLSPSGDLSFLTEKTPMQMSYTAEIQLDDDGNTLKIDSWESF